MCRRTCLEEANTLFYFAILPKEDVQQSAAPAILGPMKMSKVAILDRPFTLEQRDNGTLFEAPCTYTEFDQKVKAILKSKPQNYLSSLAKLGLFHTY